MNVSSCLQIFIAKLVATGSIPKSEQRSCYDDDDLTKVSASQSCDPESWLKGLLPHFIDPKYLSRPTIHRPDVAAELMQTAGPGDQCKFTNFGTTPHTDTSGLTGTCTESGCACAAHMVCWQMWKAFPACLPGPLIGLHKDLPRCTSRATATVLATLSKGLPLHAECM